MAAIIDLTQATFLVPLKPDSLERVRNPKECGVLHPHHPRHADSHSMKTPSFADNTQKDEKMLAMDRQAPRVAIAAFPWRDAAGGAPDGQAGGPQP